MDLALGSERGHKKMRALIKGGGNVKNEIFCVCGRRLLCAFRLSAAEAVQSNVQARVYRILMTLCSGD